jgi:hypothetical protein
LAHKLAPRERRIDERALEDITLAPSLKGGVH